MNKNRPKNDDKRTKNSLKVVEMKELPETPPRLRLFTRDVKYLKVKDVKRAYSKLIQDFCRGVITSEDAKVLAYLFGGYLTLIKDIEFESRLESLEEKVGDEKKHW